MSILFRYVSREILAATLLAVFALLGLVSFFDLLNELAEAHTETYTPLMAMAYVALNVPIRVYELLPVAALIGGLFAWNRLAQGAEFSVMRTAGLSMARLVVWMVMLGAFLGGLTLVLGEFVTPHAEQAANQLKVRATSGVVARAFKSGLWAKDGNNFINIQELRPDTSLSGITLYAFSEDAHLQTLRRAGSGQWQQEGGWLLREVTETTITPQFTRTVKLPDQTWRSAITPDLLAVLMVSPDRMSMLALQAYSQHLRDNHQDAQRYEIALWNKMIYPVAGPIMMLLALAFAYRPPRSSGAGGRLLAGVLLGLGFHLANRLVAQVAQILDWSAPAAAVVPMVLIGLSAITAVWWLDRR